MSARNLINNRLAALACMAFVLLVLAACSGGSGSGNTTVREPVFDNCDATSVRDNGTCETFAVLVNERAPTPFVEDGEPISLHVVLLKPVEDGRYPAIIFHHGSTGDGSDPSRFGNTFYSKQLALYFVRRGYIVAFPQRRGRGRSGGLYDEGFKSDRSGYSCARELALSGAAHALEDLDILTDWLLNRADVDTTQLLVGGVSRGGILSLAHAAQRPDVYVAAINFVGGWIAEGCGDYAAINRSLFESAAAFPGPTLWLYGANDSFYSLTYSRSNFDAFTAAGGLGSMVELSRSPGLNGHFIINDLELWKPVMDDFLTRHSRS